MPDRPHLTTDRFEIRKACVGPLENNTYVVVCTHTGRSVIIDAAAEPDVVVELTAGTNPTAILTTHGHADHVGAAAAVAARLSIPVRIHSADAAMAGVDGAVPLGPGTIDVGDVAMDVLHTPGHTPGSLCFLLPGVVLTGDTLFPGGPGATRGNKEHFEQIIASIVSKLFTLDDDTVVMPGHGLDTTIGEELPQLEGWVERGW